MPVALSGVIFGAVTLNGGSSQDRPPENALSIISPFGPFGVWQLPQVRMPLTRYSPRLTRSAFDDWAWAPAANTVANARPTIIARIVMIPPSWTDTVIISAP